jgi:hypothetical protein
LNSGLHLEPLYQPFFVKVFFEIGSLEPFAQGWLRTAILLISASRVARITGMSHQHLTALVFIMTFLYTRTMYFITLLTLFPSLFYWDNFFWWWWYWGLNSVPCTC